jgi:hypothetical protein
MEWIAVKLQNLYGIDPYKILLDNIDLEPTTPSNVMKIQKKYLL